MQELIPNGVIHGNGQANGLEEERQAALLPGRFFLSPLANGRSERFVHLALDHHRHGTCRRTREYEDVVLRSSITPGKVDLVFGDGENRAEVLKQRLGGGGHHIGDLLRQAVWPCLGGLPAVRQRASRVASSPMQVRLRQKRFPVIWAGCEMKDTWHGMSSPSWAARYNR